MALEYRDVSQNVQQTCNTQHTLHVEISASALTSNVISQVVSMTFVYLVFWIFHALSVWRSCLRVLEYTTDTFQV